MSIRVIRGRLFSVPSVCFFPWPNTFVIIRVIRGCLFRALRECVFRGKLAIDSDRKLATDSGLKLATCSGGKLATFPDGPEWVANIAPE